ncbi:Peptidyl-prolyl cis-trans isomerase SurA [Chitinispirillum alkaliphilum]|nr:Peptidyl-prolyl cis-trans isomerase SurA [Chitinispirillum alkaliphilum]
MKKISIFVVSLVFTFTVFCSKKDPDSQVAIVVNGQEITAGEIQLSAEMLKMEMERLMQGSPFQESAHFRTNAAQQLIANLLMVEKAIENDITADSALVQETFNRMKSQFSSRDEFVRELENIGETVESVFSQIEQGIMVELLMKEVLSQIDSVTEEECRQFYQSNTERFKESPKVRISQIIFLDYRPDDGEEVRSRANTALNRLKEGQDFQTVAQKFSSRPSSVDMGYFRKGEIREELEELFFSMEVGETSDIITERDALFIFKKEEEQPARQLSFEEVRERIKNSMEFTKRSELFSEYVDNLISKADIEYRDSSLILNTAVLPNRDLINH